VHDGGGWRKSARGFPGTDTPDMNFWLTLPEIRCQACLSPFGRISAYDRLSACSSVPKLQ
jgi:hypothetical protein